MAVTEVTSRVTDNRRDELLAPRVGVVGAGFIGTVHARAALAAGAHLVGAVASTPERGADAAVALRADQGYASLDAMLSGAMLDVLHVCTPNVLHHDAVLAAIAAGVHVVCEKPLATSLGDAEDMWAAAQRAGVVGTVPFVYRFHPMVREMRARIGRGDSGVVGSVNGAYLQDWLSRSSDDNWRVDARTGGASRAFGDIGSHWCDLLEFVIGDRLARLSARTSVVLDRGAERPTEDVATVSLETARGTLGVLVVSQVAAGHKNRLTLNVLGTEASHAFDQELPELLWVGRREGSMLLHRDPEHLTADAARLSMVPAGHAQGYQDCFNAFVADTYSAIRGTPPPGLPTFDDGLRAAFIAEAVMDSAAANGAWVEVAG